MSTFTPPETYQTARKMVDDSEDLFLIATGNMPRMVAQLEKMEKRAKKINRSAPKMEFLKRYEVEGYDTNMITTETTRISVFQYDLVRINGEAPHIPGWIFVGSISHLPTDSGGTTEIFQEVPGQKIPEKFRGRYMCDHCNYKRRRNDTFILMNKTGDHLQIGSTCVKDFTGGVDPKVLAGWLRDLNTVILMASEDEERGPGSRGLIHHETFLAFVAASMRVEGWMPRSKNELDNTSERAQERMNSKSPVKGNKESPYYFEKRVKDWEKKAPTDDDKELASKALEWAQDLNGDANDYLKNLNAVANAIGLDYKSVGISASMIQAYQKSKVKVDDRESNWVGEEKKRYTTWVNVVVIKSIEGMYGTRGLHIMYDDDGNRLTWFASSETTWLEAGSRVKIIGTVKKHEIYQDKKQTIINRVRVL